MERYSVQEINHRDVLSLRLVQYLVQETGTGIQGSKLLSPRLESICEDEYHTHLSKLFVYI